jgi:predicted MPP superfamily phosphohydrolase
MTDRTLRLSRRQWLAATGCGVVAAIGSDGWLIEPNRIIVTSHSLAESKGGSTTRIVQLTDLHLHDVGHHVRAVAAQTNALRPDLIALTGDSVDRRDALPLLAEFLELLPSETPKVATLGNWEHWAGVDASELRSLYDRYHCRLLVNESATFTLRGRSFSFTGLDDLVGGAPNLVAATRGGSPGDATRILIQHCPAFRDAPALREPNAGAPFRLMLSGHTHGGQIAPFGRALYRPQGSGRYVSGWYRDADRVPMYVSRGIGTSVVPIRLGAVPEIAAFDL